MIGITVRAVSGKLCINMSASLLGMLEFFQYQDAAAFTENKAVSSRIKRT